MYFAAFTLLEVVAALALMAIIIPVIYEALNLAGLAGEVAQRKALAARIGERALDEAIIGNPTQFARAGSEQSGPSLFRWTLKDEPWTELNKAANVSTPNGISQTGVSSANIHEYSVDVVFAAQGKDYTVHLSTLVNITPPQ
jgi:type II secretory pathway pseudopilin PulG